MIRTTSLAVLLGVIALPATAQPRTATPAATLDREFTASDTNRDGALSRVEVEARMAKMRSGKTKLTAAQAKKLAALWFTRTDANRDGKVSRAESQAMMTRMMARYDANGNGTIDPAERSAAKAGVTR